MKRAHRVSRRAALKTGAIALSSLLIPRMVHAAWPRPQPHPTWNVLLDHVGTCRYATLGDRPDMGLRTWVHDLVLCPEKPQRTLLLSGTEASGKHVFNEAMRLLLPKGGVVSVSRDPWPEPGGHILVCHPDIWLMVAERCSPRCINRLGNAPPNSAWRTQGRCLKWSLAYNGVFDWSLPNIIEFDVRPPAILKPDLMRRLEDERDAFRSTLRQAA